MAVDNSPHVERSIVDRSLKVLPQGVGGGGFVMGAQWGAVNKVKTVQGRQGLLDNYGTPIIGTNEKTWWNVVEFIEGYDMGSANIVRACADTSSTKNAFLMVNRDCTTHAWRSTSGTVTGQPIPRRLNEDKAEPTVYFTEVRLTVAATTNFAVGDVVTQAVSLATGTIIAFDNGATKYIYLTSVTGTFDTTNHVTNAGSGDQIPSAVSSADAYSDVLAIYARYPGSIGNNLKVAITDFDNFTTATYAPSKNVDELFNEAPLSEGTLVVAATTGWTVGDTITGGTSTATGIIDSIDGLNVYLREVEGKFQAAETATDGSNPTTVTSYTQTKDEIAIVVLLDEEVVESHIVSILEGATGFGGVVKFIDDYLERNSDYIFSKAKTDATGTYKTIADFTGSVTGTALTGGASVQPAYTELQTAYTKLIGSKDYDTYAIADCHDFSDYSTNYKELMKYIVNAIKDELAYFAYFNLPLDGIDADSFDIADAKAYTNLITSNVAEFHDQWKEIYDIYNKKFYFIPTTGDVMGVHMRTIQKLGAWEAPFGLEKGTISNCSKVYHSLAQGKGSAVSQLAKIGVNSIVYKKNSGFVLWGNYTMYNPASDMSKINTMHLLLKIMIDVTPLLETFISKNINDKLFENINNTVDRGYLKDLADKGAFDNLDGDNGYLFVCDKSNNTAVSRNRREINCDFYIKAPKAAEFINFRAIVVPSGVTWEMVS